MKTPTEEELSRAVNAALGHDPREMFCSHVYRHRYRCPRWFVVWIALDLHFWWERGEVWHCRRRWLQHQEPALDDLINAGH